MSKYEYMVKFNGKYYKAGEEVPDNIQPVKEAVETQQKEEQKRPGTTPVKPDVMKSILNKNPLMQTGFAQKPIKEIATEKSATPGKSQVKASKQV